MSLSLSTRLKEFTDPTDPAQLSFLEDILAEAVAQGLSQADKRAMLEVFEQFPEDDGFEVFWSIVHALEHVDGYDEELVASVRRIPTKFNTLMINRMINAGIESAAGVLLRELFAEALAHELISPTARDQVEGFLSYQARRPSGA